VIVQDEEIETETDPEDEENQTAAAEDVGGEADLGKEGDGISITTISQMKIY
jgi:hypothetical protein